ncbi:unnamed protein product [Hermetia illucens]|uniref:Uncharacterized protein n=1 Tax=Hermetia illucens TaxID=343691 RepID=A0A7R8UXL1_HERIL|nr:unnamed protein product [Hermetia illucens]
MSQILIVNITLQTEGESLTPPHPNEYNWQSSRVRFTRNYPGKLISSADGALLRCSIASELFMFIAACILK